MGTLSLRRRPSECVCVSSLLVCVRARVSCSDSCVCVCQPLSRVRLSPTPWTVACQAPPSLGFSRQHPGAGCHALLTSSFWATVHTGLGSSRQTASHPDYTCDVQIRFQSQDPGMRAATLGPTTQPPADGDETFETASLIGQNTRIKDKKGGDTLKPRKRLTRIPASFLASLRWACPPPSKACAPCPLWKPVLPALVIWPLTTRLERARRLRERCSVLKPGVGAPGWVGR